MAKDLILSPPRLCDGPSVLARALYLHDYQLLPYARTAEAMRELFGCAMSAATLSTAVQRCADGLAETVLVRTLNRADD